MNTCYRSAANVVLCSLLLTLFSSVAVAQSDSAPVMSSDAVKPEKALSPEQTDAPPVRSLGYSRRDKALSPSKLILRQSGRRATPGLRRHSRLNRPILHRSARRITSSPTPPSRRTRVSAKSVANTL